MVPRCSVEGQDSVPGGQSTISDVAVPALAQIDPLLLSRMIGHFPLGRQLNPEGMQIPLDDGLNYLMLIASLCLAPSVNYVMELCFRVTVHVKYLWYDVTILRTYTNTSGRIKSSQSKIKKRRMFGRIQSGLILTSNDVNDINMNVMQLRQFYCMASTIPLTNSVELSPHPASKLQVTADSPSPHLEPFMRHHSVSHIGRRLDNYSHIPMKKQRISWNKSSATLRHTTHSYRFGQDSRFPRQKNNYQDAMQLKYPSTLHKRGPSQGYGQKVSVPLVFMGGRGSCTEHTPHYQTTKNISSNKRGKSFGIGWKNFEPSRTIHRASVHSTYQAKFNPGPNKYEQPNPQNTKRSSSKIKMHERLEMFTTRNATLRCGQPDPFSYPIKESLVKRTKSGHGIGFGQRVDFTAPYQHNPGPIYTLKGMGDSFTHLKNKLKVK